VCVCVCVCVCGVCVCVHMCMYDCDVLYMCLSWAGFHLLTNHLRCRVCTHLALDSRDTAGAYHGPAAVSILRAERLLSEWIR